jgi:hypothetical protein
MNNKIIRAIIKEQLQNILMESPTTDAQKEKLRQSGAQSRGGVWYDASGKVYLGRFEKDQWIDAKNDSNVQQPPQQPQPQQEPESELDPLKSKVSQGDPEWLKDDKFEGASNLADRLSLIATDQPGVWASMGEDDQPISVAQYSEDPNAPLVPVPGLPDELADQIEQKINDEMNSIESEPQEEPPQEEPPQEEPPQEEPPQEEPQTKKEDDPEVDSAAMDKFSKSVYGKNEGVLIGLDMKNGRPTSNPPSDAIARQTALETGFPPPGKIVKSKTTGEAAAPAPGNAGSMFNEILSVEGCTIAIEFEKATGRPMTVSEIEYMLHKQFGNTEMAKQNQIDATMYKKKLRIVAEASHRKNLRYKTAMKNNSDFGDVENINQFYGASDSLMAQSAIIENMPPNAKIFGPQGELKEINVSNRSKTELKDAVMALAKKQALAGNKFDDSITITGPKSNPQIDEASADAYVDEIMNNPSDPMNIRKFVTLMAMAGGGGANPSDTATFVQSKNGNVMVMWHSDKMERGDQQANSTLTKEASGQIETVEELVKKGVLDEKQAAQAIGILNEFNKRVDTLESADPSPDISRTLQGLMKNQKRKADIAAAVNSLGDKYKKFIAGKNGERSFDEFLQFIADPDNTKITDNDRKVFAKLSDALEKNDNSFSSRELASISSLQLGVQARKDVVSSIYDRIKKLDKINSKNGPVGQLLESHNIIDKLHLYAMNEPSDLAYQSGMCETIIGSSGVNGEVLRRALGVNNTEDLLSNIKVGSPVTKEGDYTDPDTGMPEAMLQRSTSSYETNSNGENLIWVIDSKGDIVGKASANAKLKPGQQLKTLKDGKTPVQVGVVTGQKSLIYYQNKDGKRFPISMQMVRSKAGATGRLGTAYVYSKELQDLIKQYEKAGLVAEAVRRYLKKKNLIDTTVSDFKVIPLLPLSRIVEDIKENTPMELFLQEIENGIYIDE